MEPNNPKTQTQESNTENKTTKQLPSKVSENPSTQSASTTQDDQMQTNLLHMQHTNKETDTSSQAAPENSKISSSAEDIQTVMVEEVDQSKDNQDETQDNTPTLNSSSIQQQVNGVNENPSSGMSGQPTFQNVPVQNGQMQQVQTNDEMEVPPPSTPERIRRDFSFAQVLASVLSALTCMILATKIGLLGGLLGAAIGAGVAAVASQVYKSILYSTSDKIKYKQQLMKEHARRRAMKLKGTTKNTSESSPLTAQTEAITKHSLTNNTQVTPEGAPAPSSPHQSNMPQERKKSALQFWKVILIVAGITMLSVALSVVAIDYITKGEGIGKKPEVIYITKYITANDNNRAPESSQSENAPANTTQPSNTNQSSENNKNASTNTEQQQNQDQEQNKNENQNTQGSQSQNESNNSPSEGEQSTSPSEKKEETQKPTQAEEAAQQASENS